MKKVSSIIAVLAIAAALTACNCADVPESLSENLSDTLPSSVSQASSSASGSATEPPPSGEYLRLEPGDKAGALTVKYAEADIERLSD